MKADQLTFLLKFADKFAEIPGRHFESTYFLNGAMGITVGSVSRSKPSYWKICSLLAGLMYWSSSLVRQLKLQRAQ
jgi:hypothetical protein